LCLISLQVNIHQSLHSHPNIVTLHRTLETSSFLLLLLEYVPGEDLFYFLEQARDHYESSSHTPDPTEPSSESASRTPPTPSLLSTMNSSQLLSRTRLRLISSMFSQMCDAVAACHTQQVFHRDIKPENFIVTDGYTEIDGRRERKVIVKLTDFGLSTTDVESSDMDCGSAPYMSYGKIRPASVFIGAYCMQTECRNNVAPSYRPRAADVWSLGIVLINMFVFFDRGFGPLYFRPNQSPGCTTSILGRIPRRVNATRSTCSGNNRSTFSCSALSE
jgi:serine/threonine protein kinase